MNSRLALQPKHRRLSHQLRQRIVVENLAPGDRFMTVRDIAKEYEVSIVTAHRSVQELVADNTLTVHQFRGCFIGEAARALRTSEAKPLITILTSESVFSSVDDFMPESFLRGLRESLPLARVRMEYAPAQDTITFLNAFVTANPARPGTHGYVLRSVDADVKRFFADRNLAAVVTGNLEPGVELPCVQRDERHIAYTAVQYLLSKGHREIVYIEWDAPLEGHRRRREGFTTALTEASIVSSSADADRLIINLPPTEAQLTATLRQLVNRPKRPTAVIFGHERHAAWGIRFSRDMGIAIPRQLALLGLAGGVLTDHLVPRLTIFPRKNYETGAGVGILLAKLLKGETIQDRCHRIPSALVENETT